jgi:hypothetical protein
MTLVDDARERERQNKSPGSRSRHQILDDQTSNRSMRLIAEHGSSYFEAKDIVAALFAVVMLLAPLTVAAVGGGV